jgi:hypothetical protein
VSIFYRFLVNVIVKGLCHLYFFKLAQPLTCLFKPTQPFTVSTVQFLYTVMERKPDRKPYPLPDGLKNPYRNFKSENSQDYAQKPQRNFTFMNSASGYNHSILGSANTE